MQFNELAAARRSVRKFLPDPVNKSDIKDILSIATTAANSGNEQMWHFKIVTNESLKHQMADIVRTKIETVAQKTSTDESQLKPVIGAATLFVNAPAVIVVSTIRYRSKADQLLLASGYSELEVDDLRCRPDLQSIGAVIQMFLLAALEKGYGTCWMTGPMFARPELESLLGVKPPRSLAAMIAMGKFEVAPGSKGRKPVEEVVEFID